MSTWSVWVGGGEPLLGRQSLAWGESPRNPEFIYNQAAERRQVSLLHGCGSHRSQNLSHLWGFLFLSLLFLGLTPQARLFRRSAACEGYFVNIRVAV